MRADAFEGGDETFRAAAFVVWRAFSLMGRPDCGLGL
jgi:hypothetical protein